MWSIIHTNLLLFKISYLVDSGLRDMNLIAIKKKQVTFLINKGGDLHLFNKVDTIAKTDKFKFNKKKS